MRNPQMPDYGLECFGVRGDVCGIDCRDDNRHVRNLRSISAVAAHDPKDRATLFLPQLQRAHQIRADIFFNVPATYRRSRESRLFR